MSARKGFRRWRWFGIGGVVVASSCGVLDPEEADPRFTPLDPDSTWGLLEREAFTYRTPPGFENLNLQPIDSDAAAFARGDATLGHDYGWYSGPWTDDGTVGGVPIREKVRREARIGGRTAEVVSFRYGDRWVVHAYWPRVRRRLGQDEDLVVRGETPHPSDRAELLATVYSVRFR